MSKRAVVVGGGFVGVACALHLQMRGFVVTLLEAGPSIAGNHAASAGNAVRAVQVENTSPHQVDPPC